jgi:hypothetical protein
MQFHWEFYNDPDFGKKIAILLEVLSSLLITYFDFNTEELNMHIFLFFDIQYAYN